MALFPHIRNVIHRSRAMAALLAGYFPAGRAASLNPLEALRAE